MPGAGKSFICYSRSDSSFAVKLAKNLRNNGADIWMDQFDIPPGVDWDTAISTALEKCHSLIVVLSPEAFASGNVLNEISYARDKDMRIIPLMLKTCRVPLIITRKNYIDFRTEADKGLEKLLHYLNNPETAIEVDQRPRNYKRIIVIVAAAIVCSGIVVYAVNQFNQSKEIITSADSLQIKKAIVDTAGKQDSTDSVAHILHPQPPDSVVKLTTPKTFSADFAGADIVKTIAGKTGLMKKIGSANYRITLSYNENKIIHNADNTAYMLADCFPIIKINGIFCTEATCCKIESSEWVPNKSMVADYANTAVRASAAKCYRNHLNTIIACLPQKQ